MRLTSGVGVAAKTTACVIVWYLLLVGIAWLGRGSLDSMMPLLFVLAVPILPGASVCVVVGVHNSACVPASAAANILFYLGAIFLIRKRRARAAAKID